MTDGGLERGNPRQPAVISPSLAPPAPLARLSDLIPQDRQAGGSGALLASAGVWRLETAQTAETGLLALILKAAPVPCCYDYLGNQIEVSALRPAGWGRGSACRS